MARAYGITWNWSATSENTPSRVDDKHVERLLKQFGDKVGGFDKSLDQLFIAGGSTTPERRDEVRQSVADFRQATDRLRDRVNGRQSNTLDVEEVLRRGVSIDRFMQRYQLSAQAEQNWLSLRRDLDTLARAVQRRVELEKDRGTRRQRRARPSAIASRERISSRTTGVTIAASG